MSYNLSKLMLRNVISFAKAGLLCHALISEIMCAITVFLKC